MEKVYEHYEWQDGAEYVGLFFEPDNTTRPCRVCHTPHVGWWRVHRATDGDIESGPLSYDHYYCDVCIEDWKRAFDQELGEEEPDHRFNPEFCAKCGGDCVMPYNDEPGGEDAHLEEQYEDAQSLSGGEGWF